MFASQKTVKMAEQHLSLPGGIGNNSLGRVQTPVLAEICRRYRERENHMPADSWPVFISLCKNDRILKMRHVDDLVVRREALALMSGFHPVSVFTCLTVRKEGGSRGKSFHSTWAVPESFGIARESILPYVHVTM